VTLVDSEPETTDSFDLGYRYQGDGISLSAALWKTNYDNRIVNAFDEELGFSIFRNLGSVELQGFDIEIGYQPVEGLTLFGSASYNDSEVQDDVILSATTALPTAGKELVETPDWTLSGRVQYEIAGFTLGFQGKYTGDRWASDVNDEIAEAFTVFDADIRYDFAELGYEGTYIQFNATNLFDEEYLGSYSSVENAQTVRIGGTDDAPITRSGRTAFYSIGAPQTFQVSIGVKF
jgi:iron complex outermembrane receptor protein